MGKVVESIVAADENCQIVAGIDARTPKADYPVFATPNQCNVDADVIIDFSTATAIPNLLAFSKSKQIPVVLCTTGFSDELDKEVKDTSTEVAVLKSANMSVGVNLILSLVQKAADVLFDSGFDIEIVEKHHNQKIDAPSGTALAIADSINEALDNKMHYVYDRSQVMEKRDKYEIGIHALRGGTIVGEHDVVFAGQDEIITISHLAMSKEIFAVGAVKAAKYLAGKPAGFYSMKEVTE
jgi:dihydrodipicolinate reductase